ncbi:phage tail protein [Sphingomonas kaistensis]|uniref:Phage tail protein n=1 Tax=Sphingomonas kaistensis TaxID=298708 RepID=A0ABZ2G5T4_9SPHN
MATLVLSAAGAAIGGPVGGLVGSFVGRQFDRSFGAGSGTRLSDLRAPSSQYGDPIPRVLRQMRVAGVVLWASEPVATALVSKSVSEQASSVSFAYGLSSGFVEDVGRIWADGRLIRDGEGRQDVSFTLRLNHGDEDQLSDPLIASLLGEENTPAFRGIAYLVFENFDLSSFGNRLPLITVEVLANGDPIIADDIVRSELDLAGVTNDRPHKLDGFALTGDNGAVALQPLFDALKPALSYDGRKWGIGAASSQHVIDSHFWALESDRQSHFRMDGQCEVPTKVSVRYFDPAIDYLAGEKSARQPGVERLRRIELPAAMSGERAKALAFEQLQQVAQESKAYWLTLPLSYAAIQVGDHVGSGSSRDFVVCEKTLNAGQLRLRLRPTNELNTPNVVDVEAPTKTPMLQREDLTIALVELPNPSLSNDLEIAILVSGGHKPFRALPVVINSAGTEVETISARVAAPLGRLRRPLPSASGSLLDLQNIIEVEFDQDPELTSCTDEAMFAGANLICVDGEFMQFAIAKPMGAAKYELSRLVRRRFDSGRDAPHDAGSSAILLDPASLATFKVPREVVGTVFTARVSGPDNAAAEATLPVAGTAARPWAPAHLNVRETAGGLELSWVRRCRDGGAWLDNVDAPLGSSREAYRVTLRDGLGMTIEAHSDSPHSVISSIMLDQMAPRPWRLEVRQIGDFAAGNPLVHIID